MILKLIKSSQCSSGKGWEDEACLVDIGVVVFVDRLLFLGSPASQRSLDISVGVLAANHEADLTRWVSWNGGVCILDSWEDLLAVLLQLGDEWEVKPLVLGYVG